MSSFSLVITSNGEALTQEYDRPIRLTGDWEVTLTHMRFPDRPWPIYVFCDLVDYTFVGSMRMQFLDFWATKNHRNSSPQYVKVVKKRFSSINVTVKKQLEDEDLIIDQDVTCVLRFRKV